MSRFENLPEEVEKRLKTDTRYVSGNELLPAEVAEVMYAADRPWFTVDQMNSEFNHRYHQDTVRDKLSKLRELEIVESQSVGKPDIYYLNDDRSEWPIPPDVEVEAERTEPTLSEFLSPWYIQLGLVGLLGPALGGVILIVGSFAAAGVISIPPSITNVISLGLTISIISYILLLISVVLGVLNRTMNSEYSIIK
jgi:hypothetical protein